MVPLWKQMTKPSSASKSIPAPLLWLNHYKTDNSTSDTKRRLLMTSTVTMSAEWTNSRPKRIWSTSKIFVTPWKERAWSEAWRKPNHLGW